MKEESFDINKTKCGPNGRCALAFALGVEDDPIHEETVKMVLSVLDLWEDEWEDGAWSSWRGQQCDKPMGANLSVGSKQLGKES